MYLLVNKINLLIKSWFFSGIDHEKNHFKLQILLTNTISTLGFFSILIYGYIIQVFTTGIFFQLRLFFSFLYIIIPILNKFGYNTFSRYLLVIIANSITLFLSIVFDDKSNFHIFFILHVVVVFLIFKYNEIKKILFSLLISFISIGIYETNYWITKQHFYRISLTDSENFLLNNALFISLILAILVFITFFIIYMQKSEDRLLNLNEELKEKTANLIQVEKFSALGELTAGISHELNQPLNVINIISQAVIRDVEKDRFTSDNLKNDMCEINIQIQRMSEIISHMKIFTRSSVGFPKERLNINIIIDGVLNFFREQFKDNKIEIYVDLTREIPYILGDSLRLEHLLINIITNARDAVVKSEMGMKIIKIKTEEVKKDDMNYILFQVYDNGEGISEQLTDKIFQPFFTTKDPGQGTGLGLAIVNKIVEDHKGHIKFTSKEKQGTTFDVYLPVENSFK